MSATNPTRRAFARLAVLAFVSTGCSPSVKLGRVSGRVTYKGHPVPNGAITFLPNPSGPPATAAIQSDGTYSLQTPGIGDGAVLGAHAVMITALREGPATEPDERDPLPPPIIPVKYGNTSTSGLTAEVHEGDNTVNFDLKEDKPTPKK
jgi:hypothetical protein